MAYFSTQERPLDSKRRIVVPQEFRAGAASVFAFPGIRGPYVACGGEAFLEELRAEFEDLPRTDPVRRGLEMHFYGARYELPYDSGGRIAVPAALCTRFSFGDTVAVMGMKNHFQIWDPLALADHQAKLWALVAEQQDIRGLSAGASASGPQP